jgi:hypothetical protein
MELIISPLFSPSLGDLADLKVWWQGSSMNNKDTATTEKFQRFRISLSGTRGKD